MFKLREYVDGMEDFMKVSLRYYGEFFVRDFASKVELKEFLINEHPEWLELTVEKLTVTQTMIIVFVKKFHS